MNENYDSISDVEITDNHVQWLREAGASPEFLSVLRFPLDQVDNVDRHSVQELIREHIYYGKINLDKNPEDYSHDGGGFFTQLWDGDLYHAFRRGDPNNQEILRERFGEDPIIESAIRDGWGIEHARKTVSG
jgi:hypothetical protein